MNKNSVRVYKTEKTQIVVDSEKMGVERGIFATKMRQII